MVSHCPDPGDFAMAAQDRAERANEKFWEAIGACQTVDDLRRVCGGDLVELETHVVSRVTVFWIAPGERVHTCVDCGAVVDGEFDECTVCMHEDEEADADIRKAA